MLSSMDELMLRLCHSPGAQQEKTLKLLQHLDDPLSLYSLSSTELMHHHLTSANTAFIRQMKRLNIESSLALLKEPNTHFVHYFDPRYPPLLKETVGPPLGLFVAGDVHQLKCVQLAVVGSRKASSQGKSFAYKLAKDLSACGFGITSGLAYGIDSLAHQGALDSGRPTIAVLGTGLDVIYPKRHRTLFEKIIQSGALVTEFKFGTGVRPDHFPRRNRIISGLSQACVVIEADLKSGSLITARYALEQNRDVFAMPGNIANPQSKGCHQLIKEGAFLLDSIEDILHHYPAVDFMPAPVEKDAADPPCTEVERHLLNLIDFSVTNVDQLVVRSGRKWDMLAQTLVSLEVNGWISRVPGGYIKNKSNKR